MRRLPLISAVILAGLYGSAAPPASAEPATAAPSRILVLPFSSPPGGTEAWVGKAVQQDLLTDLTQGTSVRVYAPAGATPAAVALAWVVGRAGVASTLIGASRLEQVASNVASLGVVLTPEQQSRLDQASEPLPVAPFSLFSPFIRQMVFGGHQVTTMLG